MEKFYAVTIVICLGAIIGCEGFLGDSLPENQWARDVFSIVDKDNSSTLSHQEVEAVYALFDQNGNGLIDAGEFIKRWVADGIGHTASGLMMFHNLDTDKDGFLSKSPDFSRTFHNFDRDGNNVISRAEFVVTWIKLSLS